MNQLEHDKDTENFKMWVMSYEGSADCLHHLPGDWEFGGATGDDPRADSRWRPVTYTYLDRHLRRRTISQVPRCDHEAAGSYRNLVNSRLPDHLKTYHILAAYPGGSGPVTIFSDVEGSVARA